MSTNALTPHPGPLPKAERVKAQARAVRTADGMFAVIQGGLTLGELHCEATAIQVAAAINSGPVRSVTVDRWGNNKSDAVERVPTSEAA